MFSKATISWFDQKELGYGKNGRFKKIGENYGKLGTTNFENVGIAKMNFEIHLLVFHSKK